MARLPDRFDLWVRKARECCDPARQADYILGALAGLPEWHFLNLGSKEAPRPAETNLNGERCLLVLSNVDRITEIVGEGTPPIITIPTTAAMTWCLEQKTGLLVNPGDDAALVPADQLAAFHAEWIQRGGRQAIGFWIPNMTSEEEDFWQEHGL